MTTWTVAGLLARTTEFLAVKGSTSPRLDAEVLLAEALGVERIDLYIQHDRPLTAAELDPYRELVARRARHEPVAYIVGRAHFRYLVLEVTPDVLVPRPETEELVDAVLAWLKERPLLGAGAVPPSAAVPAGTPPASLGGEPAAGPIGAPPAAALVADVGTGSGAIALSLAREAGVSVMASDLSPAALEVAARNREALDLTRLVTLRQADLLDGVDDGRLRVVVSNPPYIADEEYEGLAPDVRLFEPEAALRAGPGGLDVYRRLVPESARALGPGGGLFLEVGIDQAQAVAEIARAAGFCATAVLPDLSGRERIVRAVLPGALRLALDDAVADDLGAGTEGGERAAAHSTMAALRSALRGGAIVGLPTDTVYGLAAAWDSARGVGALFEAKGRGEERPVQVLFSSLEAVRAALPDLDPQAARVLAALLPGPYTFVVSTAVSRPPLVGTPDSLGVRVPDHAGLLDFLSVLGVPLAATSANRTGAGDAATVDEVDPEVLAACAVALVGDRRSEGGGQGPITGSEPGGAPADAGRPTRASTVVDLRPLSAGGDVVVLREGAVSAAAVRARIAALGRL